MSLALVMLFKSCFEEGSMVIGGRYKVDKGNLSS